jgi:hypothetical protein
MMIAVVSGCSGTFTKTYPSGVTFWGEGAPSWAKADEGDANYYNGKFCSPEFSGCKADISFYSDNIYRARKTFVEGGIRILFEQQEGGKLFNRGGWFNMYLYRENMILMEKGVPLIVEIVPCAISATETIDKITLRIPPDIIHDLLHGSYDGAKRASD